MLAVILFQPDDRGPREVVLELQDVVEIGAAPAIDRLVGVAGRAEVWMVGAQTAGDGVLGQIGVLVLVDQDVAEPVVEAGANIGLRPEQLGDVVEQVVKVDRVEVAKPTLVGRIHLRDAAVVKLLGLFGEIVG